MQVGDGKLTTAKRLWKNEASNGWGTDWMNDVLLKHEMDSFFHGMNEEKSGSRGEAQR